MVKKLLLEENYDSQDSYKKSIWLASHRYRMQKSIFIRIVLSGTVLDAVAEGIFTRTFFFFFLTWNEVNSTLARAKTGHETHEIKFFFSLDTYPQAKARKEKEEIDLIYLKDMNFIEKYSKYRSHFLKSPFPRSVSKQKRPHPNGKECFLCFTSCAKSRHLRMEHANSRWYLSVILMDKKRQDSGCCGYLPLHNRPP